MRHLSPHTILPGWLLLSHLSPRAALCGNILHGLCRDFAKKADHVFDKLCYLLYIKKDIAKHFKRRWIYAQQSKNCQLHIAVG